MFPSPKLALAAKRMATEKILGGLEEATDRLRNRNILLSGPQWWGLALPLHFRVRAILQIKPGGASLRFCLHHSHPMHHQAADGQVPTY